eukprot:CAMPEP_0201488894 /NCGR_PEP_ID=MMETSP0151_2-20130828/20086_1 /ASSEMBLY_ACC=CAM_ASM_000257 /TAXON_ID=200890 /ORGANISM="Paramoeba atlantica, Strain 621/1 / CCAP 1560/9" /LENGTH=391 /DNA_ID=CAMNT_0047874295 /DNA_START=62 /DNA_END=1234 /DNA_ORIENTATION=-
MGNQNSTPSEPRTPRSTGIPNPLAKLRSPARSPLSPPRKRQGGVEISPASSPAPSSPALGLQKSNSEDSDYMIEGEQEIGEGSFAVVKLGQKISTGERVAVKVIEKKNVPDEMRHLIEHECNILRRLNHKNVIHLHHATEDKNYIYLFMPYFAGGDLHAFLDDYEYLAEPIAFKIFYQLVDAVNHCHVNNIIHRDIKLENMLLDDADKLNVTLIDFGFSTIRKETDALLDDYPGSPAYAAPELMQGIPYPGYSSDIWAMGVVLYILVTGEYPFWSENRHKMYTQIVSHELDFRSFPHVSAGCQNLLINMLAKDWRKRPSIEKIRKHSWYQEHWQTVRPAVRRSSTLEQRATPPGSPMQTGDSPKTPRTPKTPKTPKSGKKEGSSWTPKLQW